jgi:predicted Zn-dependent protease with MMP-like domain
MLAPTLDDVENIAHAAYAALPAQFRELCGDVPMVVQDFPEDDVLVELNLDSDGGNAQPPTMIFLYRRPILDFWAEHEETLTAVVRHVLVHEIGHHFGLSDNDMERIEAEG